MSLYRIFKKKSLNLFIEPDSTYESFKAGDTKKAFDGNVARNEGKTRRL